MALLRKRKKESVRKTPRRAREASPGALHLNAKLEETSSVPALFPSPGEEWSRRCGCFCNCGVGVERHVPGDTTCIAITGAESAPGAGPANKKGSAPSAKSNKNFRYTFIREWRTGRALGLPVSHNLFKKFILRLINIGETDAGNVTAASGQPAPLCLRRVRTK